MGTTSTSNGHYEYHQENLFTLKCYSNSSGTTTEQRRAGTQKEALEPVPLVLYFKVLMSAGTKRNSYQLTYVVLSTGTPIASI